MRIGEYEFPDSCPENCPDRQYMERFDMSSMCFRCPVLNCSGPEEIRMMRPEDYDLDMAEGWYEWFKENGVID
jgi:hypothetical protein